MSGLNKANKTERALTAGSVLMVSEATTLSTGDSPSVQGEEVVTRRNGRYDLYLF